MVTDRMTEKFLTTLAAIETALSTSPEEHDKIGLLARALRWHPDPDREDLDALLALGESVRGRRGDGVWEVERAVCEILCDHAAPEHLPFLIKAYEFRGTHADDRRRLALQGISRIAAMTGDPTALETLASALSHNKADTRGWAIGFISEAYFALNRPLPQTIQMRLHLLAESDPSEDVRTEAANVINNEIMIH
jgi:hypothetical protein